MLNTFMLNVVTTKHSDTVHVCYR